MDRIHDLLYGVVLRGARPPIEIELIPIEQGTLFQSDELTVSAFPVKHRGPGCFGFRFDQATRRPFLAKKAEELGIPIGPIRKQLVNEQPVTLDDGREIMPDQVLGEPRPGARFVHVGDCASTKGLAKHCQNADGLVIEATYLEYEADLAKQFGHITAKQAAELAIEANVRQLYLNHLSRRYREREVLEEAQATFPGAVVARDFDQFPIKRFDQDSASTA